MACDQEFRCGRLTASLNASDSLHCGNRRHFQCFDRARTCGPPTRISRDKFLNGLPFWLATNGDEITLITHVPLLCDICGTEKLSAKLERYQPGWYATWDRFYPRILQQIHPPAFPSNWWVDFQRSMTPGTACCISLSCIRCPWAKSGPTTSQLVCQATRSPFL